MFGPHGLDLSLGEDSMRRASSSRSRRSAAWRSRRVRKTSLPVIGWLSSAHGESQAFASPAFRRGLGELLCGGTEVAFEFRWAEEKRDRLPQLAADLVARTPPSSSRAWPGHGSPCAGRN